MLLTQLVGFCWVLMLDSLGEEGVERQPVFLPLCDHELCGVPVIIRVLCRLSGFSLKDESQTNNDK